MLNLRRISVFICFILYGCKNLIDSSSSSTSNHSRSWKLEHSVEYRHDGGVTTSDSSPPWPSVLSSRLPISIFLTTQLYLPDNSSLTPNIHHTPHHPQHLISSPPISSSTPSPSPSTPSRHNNYRTLNFILIV